MTGAHSNALFACCIREPEPISYHPGSTMDSRSAPAVGKCRPRLYPGMTKRWGKPCLIQAGRPKADAKFAMTAGGFRASMLLESGPGRNDSVLDYPSPHSACPQETHLDPIAYVNGTFVPLSEAKISILDRGFLFADGIYEVSAVLDGKLIDNDSHLARLQRSVGEISLQLPETLDRITEIQKDLIARNQLANGLVYLEVTRGTHTGRDFAFPKGVKPTLVMFTSVKDIVNAPTARTGIAVITVPDIRWARRDIKSVALLAQVLAKQAAAEAGAGEAWMIEDGKVTEGGSSSAFILTQDDVIVTRQNGSEILPGCTRKAVVALAAERQLRIEERPFSIEEALAAKEAFITSASSFVQAVTSIDGKPIADGKPGSMTNRLREIYVDFARATSV